MQAGGSQEFCQALSSSQATVRQIRTRQSARLYGGFYNCRHLILRVVCIAHRCVRVESRAAKERESSGYLD